MADKKNWSETDERGIPITPNESWGAEGAPPDPCALCRSGKPIDGSDPWEWCQRMDTCAATIDWEMVHSRDRY